MLLADYKDFWANTFPFLSVILAFLHIIAATPFNDLGRTECNINPLKTSFKYQCDTL